MGQERGGLVEAVGRVTKLMRRNLLGPEKAYFVLFFLRERERITSSRYKIS
jgi:hypothetical protein